MTPLDPFDYKEPRCSQCGGEDFYYPDGDKPDGAIPVDRIIRKIDALFDKNDYAAAGRILEHWEKEARLLFHSVVAYKKRKSYICTRKR